MFLRRRPAPGATRGESPGAAPLTTCYNVPVPASRDHLDPAGEDSFPSIRSPGATYCRRCDSDVSDVPAEALYCPRCGLRIQRPSPAGDGGDACGFSSHVTRGYASAMLRLGIRYEVRHNEHEAVRCYGKSAHLGDVTAKVRLLDVALAPQLGPAYATPKPSPPPS